MDEEEKEGGEKEEEGSKAGSGKKVSKNIRKAMRWRIIKYNYTLEECMGP